jgi:O-antigen/teichoic acid export membrane protein
VTDAAVPYGPMVRPVTRGSVARVGVATAITAVCGYAVLYLAARELDPAGFSVFGVFWGAFGLVTGAANGLLQQSTREIRLAAHLGHDAGADRRLTHPLRVAAAVGVVAALVIGATATLWASHVFAEFRLLSVVLLSVGLACFCLHATLLGMLAGANRWTQYGGLMVTDAVIRVAVAVAATVVGWNLAGFLWATVAGCLSWLALLVVSPIARGVARLVAYEDAGSFLRGAAHAVAAAGASAILVMGFPVLLKATSGDLGAAGGVVILAVTLTRAPLLVPLTAMQGNLIAHFVDQRGHRLRAISVAVGVLAAVGAVGIALAAVTGPWLLRAGFGAEYDASGTLLAWLTAGALAVAVLTVTGAATVSAALHRAYSLGWVGATVASTLLLTAPLPLEKRTVIALVCGPLVGIAVHIAALTRLPQ